MEAFDALVRDGLFTTALIALPMLAVSALVGTAVAVVQAATQVQEQTLTLLPKVIAIGITVAIFGSFGIHALAELFDRALDAIPLLVAGS
ncbi:MAG TPA: flagellar biosynthetic protein FliQ [Candidatus Baltobacteraceae bacterium]|nr:flagellar biosynthetic protein FliQ [Candidatus Baltobacteraceae bacterium]